MRVLIFCLAFVSCDSFVGKKASSQSSISNKNSDLHFPSSSSADKLIENSKKLPKDCIDRIYIYCETTCGLSNITPRNDLSLNPEYKSTEKSYTCYENCIERLINNQTPDSCKRLGLF